MKKHVFELRVVAEGDGAYRLELWEPPPPDTRPRHRRRSSPMSSIGGWHMELAEGLVRRSLEANGYRRGDLRRARRRPFRLKEEDGVRLDLAFRSIPPLRLRTRIEDILHGIREMDREEALYWHAKVSRQDGSAARDALRALRTLLGGSSS